MAATRLSQLQKRILRWVAVDAQRTRGMVASSHQELVRALKRYGNDSSENGPHPQKCSFLRCKIHRFSCLLSLYLPGNHTPKPLKSFRCHHEVAKFLVNRCHTSISEVFQNQPRHMSSTVEWTRGHSGRRGVASGQRCPHDGSSPDLPMVPHLTPQHRVLTSSHRKPPDTVGELISTLSGRRFCRGFPRLF
jgi:hypothetical protein